MDSIFFQIGAAYNKLRHPSRKKLYLCVTLAEYQMVCEELAQRNKEFELLAKKLQQFEKEAKVNSGKTVADHLLGLGMPIEDLALSVRSYNTLRRVGVATVGDLVKYSIADLFDLRSIGQGSVDNIIEALSEKGYKLKCAA